MEFVFRKQSPASSAMRLSVVVALHVVMVGALMFGMGRTGIQILKPTSIEYVSIIDTPPPPAPKPEVQKPATRTPLQVTVPVPEVPVEVPPVATESIAAVPADAAISNDASSSSASSGSGTTPSVAVSAACPNSQAVRTSMRYPIVARRDGLEGDVVARFVVGASGGIRGAEILSSSNRVFNSAVLSAVQQFQCAGQGRDVVVEVPFSFRLQ